jgi:hypothetical protein
MFEKEAEVWWNNKFRPSLYRNAKDVWQEGAEFGYNKANEWHYVKDGDLPKDEKDVQVLYQDCDKVNSYTCLYDIHNESWLYYNLDECLLEPFDYKVIAWKEIVLPELKESE